MDNQMMNFFKSLNSGNVNQMAYALLQKNANNNPAIGSLFNLIQNNKENPQQALTNFAQEICKSRGIDFNEAYGNFQQQLSSFCGKK